MNARLPMLVVLSGALSVPFAHAQLRTQRVNIEIPTYEISFSKLASEINILGLQPGIDENSARQILKESGFKYKSKDSGEVCEDGNTPRAQYRICYDADTGARRFVKGRETVYLQFAPRQAGGKLLHITRYVNYTSASQMPSGDDLIAALKEKYPAPTAGTPYDFRYIQCWAYREGLPVATFGRDNFCGTSSDAPVDVSLTFTMGSRMETHLLDYTAREAAWRPIKDLVRATRERLISEESAQKGAKPEL